MGEKKKVQSVTRKLEYKLSEKQMLAEMLDSLDHEISYYENECEQLPSTTFEGLLSNVFGKVWHRKQKTSINTKDDLLYLVSLLRDHQKDLLKCLDTIERDLQALDRKMQSVILQKWDDVFDVLKRIWPGSSKKEHSESSCFRMFNVSPNPILSYNDLRGGMHVYCPRSGGYTHHGICVEDECGGVRVIHFNGDLQTGGAWAKARLREVLHLVKKTQESISCTTAPTPSETPFINVDGSSIAYIMVASVEEFAGGSPIYIAHYKYEADPQIVQARARRALWTNGGGYNFVERNCEHFATWCKTGVGKSLQVADQLAKRMLRLGEVVGKISHVEALSQFCQYSQSQAARLSETNVSFLPVP